MTQLAMILGSITVFAAGFVTWYTLWHRKVASCFERVPVGDGRTAHLVRRGVALDDALGRGRTR
jgi:hypothetical protein